MRVVAIVNVGGGPESARLRARLERAAPGRVRPTATLAEARAAIRAEVARGVDLVVFGGGDGTLVMGLVLLAEAARAAGRPEPAVGVLRLGAGNAIADAFGAGRDPAADLARLAAGEGAWRPVRLLDALGMRAPFVGVGLDSQLLEDQAAVGAAIDRVPGARRWVGGRARYALSVALRSLPRFALAERAQVVVRNLGAPAVELGRAGPTGREVAAGAELWRGALTLVAGSAIPTFGFGLRMFAFAGRDAARFQLRCGDGGLGEVLRHAPAAFRGDYFSPHVHDFLCERVELELDRDVAIEAGGELIGRRRRLTLGLAPAVTVASLAAEHE